CGSKRVFGCCMTFNRFAGLGTLHALRTLVFRSRTAWLRRSQGRERDVRDESASVCLGGAGRQCVWMFGRRPGAPCSETANTSVAWKESLQDTTRLYSKSGGLSRGRFDGVRVNVDQVPRLPMFPARWTLEHRPELLRLLTRRGW